MKALQELVARHKAGSLVGIYSVCSAHPLVIEAALRQAHADGQYALIEATSNQVNQFGGYSGMKPDAFRDYVHEIRRRTELPADRLLLGGDHLGPNCWRAEAAATALARAEQLIADYVAAGFRKIHLDCSMACADDPPSLADEVIAARAARLCQVAEASWLRQGGEAPVYVIGTEVPTAGGATEALGALAVTSPQAVTATLAAHRAAWAKHSLGGAWARVVALVVQPGVEFDNHKVVDFAPARSVQLAQCLADERGMVYEAHSTDYQTAAALAALVQQHFAILKVGPAVTFALREALWALAGIQAELGGRAGESLQQVVLAAMRKDPKYWRAYYSDGPGQTLELQYSLSDRIRYYWNVPEVRAACAALICDLRARGMPLGLLSQYLPRQYAAIRSGRIANEPHAVLLAAVRAVLDGYARACGGAAHG
ncbi:MAG TPA: D-tagatose-bisphosphate aldolase, class II, non-catalytic subunit [Steroidobacteraceae bacterium]